jgi:catechol 2,3-dioxygenase-like lactoylglutathione lyase family enzyme
VTVNPHGGRRTDSGASVSGISAAPKQREPHAGERRGLPLTSFAVVTVDHVAVTVPRDLEHAVLDWYSETLGLERLEKPEGTRAVGGWFRAGEVELHVTVEGSMRETSGHFGVVVDDFDAALGRLRGAGSVIEPARAIPGRSRCYTRDPAGNQIEILSYEDGSRA